MQYYHKRCSYLAYYFDCSVMLPLLSAEESPCTRDQGSGSSLSFGTLQRMSVSHSQANASIHEELSVRNVSTAPMLPKTPSQPARESRYKSKRLNRGAFRTSAFIALRRLPVRLFDVIRQFYDLQTWRAKGSQCLRRSVCRLGGVSIEHKIFQRIMTTPVNTIHCFAYIYIFQSSFFNAFRPSIPPVKIVIIHVVQHCRKSRTMLIHNIQYSAAVVIYRI